MPKTRLERLVAGVGVALIACLFVLTAVAWRDYRDAPAASASSLEPAVPRRPRVSPAAATPPARATVPGSPARTAKQSPGARTTDTIGLRAARGDCWLEVRRGDDVLYAGTLVQGQTRTFTGRTLELTLGAPGNVDATVNGKAVRNFPQGASTVVLTDGRLTSTPIS